MVTSDWRHSELQHALYIVTHVTITMYPVYSQLACPSQITHDLITTIRLPMATYTRKKTRFYFEQRNFKQQEYFNK